MVLGFPLQLDGREGPAVQAMREFAVRLEQGLSVPLVLWDERLTTKAAEDMLIAADVSRKKRKGAVDRVAAAILLQSYLASREAEVSQPEWQERQFDEPTVHTTYEAPKDARSSAGRDRRSRRGRVSDH